MSSNIVGFILFVLNFFDGIATYGMVKQFGLMTEMNPLMRSLMVILSPEGWLPLKIMVGFLLWCYLSFRCNRLSFISTVGFGIAALALSVVDSIHVLNFLFP
jgi:hypothetical protein